MGVGKAKLALFVDELIELVEADAQKIHTLTCLTEEWEKIEPFISEAGKASSPTEEEKNILHRLECKNKQAYLKAEGAKACLYPEKTLKLVSVNECVEHRMLERAKLAEKLRGEAKDAYKVFSYWKAYVALPTEQRTPETLKNYLKKYSKEYSLSVEGVEEIEDHVALKTWLKESVVPCEQDFGLNTIASEKRACFTLSLCGPAMFSSTEARVQQAKENLLMMSKSDDTIPKEGRHAFLEVSERSRSQGLGRK